MKKTILLFFSLLLVATLVISSQSDIVNHPSCPYCGMDRSKFSFSRMLLIYDDGSEVGTCSVRCAAVDMVNNLDKAPVQMLVGDYFTDELIDAETAIWVIGGDRPGVMSRRAKWAFADQSGAEDFLAENNGDLANLEEALQAAYTDLYEDTRMIRERRKARRARMAAEQTTANQ
ncbi:MAG: nitrous oxide reductase accessory protein NosL [Desulfuromonadales bacterium]|nr:nitrous oxide reductase accessory protein NosL [Desulfuromonadales bacterium]